MTKKNTAVASLIMICSMLLSACVGAVPTNTPAAEVEPITIETLPPLPTQAISTLTTTPTLISFSPTPNPPTPIPPTITPLRAPAFSLPAATRVRFATGATSGAATGTIRLGQTQNFVLGALQGQPLQVFVNSTDNDVTMSITAESGLALLPASQGSSGWQGTLPATQDYYIQIIGGAREQDYSLSVSVPNRIQFAPGTTSATVSGKTVDGYIASYVVAARGGQTMNILLKPEPNVAALTVWGFSDGQPYIRSHMGSTTFNMQLPSTQDYIIDVVPQAGQEVNFTLRVEIQ